MTIQKFEGKTKEEAIEKAKAQYGDAVLIMNVKKIRPNGLLGMFQSGTVEVTVAIEDDLLSNSRQETPVKSALEQFSASKAGFEQFSSKGGFTAVADEDIKVPPVKEEAGASSLSKMPVNNQIIYDKEPPKSPEIDAEALRSAFKEVGDLISKESTIPVSDVSDYDPSSSIIRASQISKPKTNKNITEFPAGEPDNITPIKQETVKEEKPRPVFEDRSAVDSEEKPDKNMKFIRVLYNNLVEHEVDEHYVNHLLSDLNRLFRDDVGMDFLISNVYQKMILQIGHPITINVNKRPKVVLLIGPTGVGKTTTIAKLASRFKMREGKRIAFITADTYRIAAEEQLTTYANILKTPIDVLYEANDLPNLLSRYHDYDLVLIDTVGFSDKNDEQRMNLEALLSAVPEKYEKDIFLVLSATTKYKDLKRIVDRYKEFTEFSLIFTKLDETDCYGNIYNIRQYAQAPLSYITTGQKVPEDISVVDSQKLVKNLLGGN
ncbi:MAG: flagellar biosynthesis protein FlhF [Lachnospiraceae bacterium]|nr:flagellar biosynthesis protein FlhF [Lachnospiraceae bacterium]